jgi:hypothetical protein
MMPRCKIISGHEVLGEARTLTQAVLLAQNWAREQWSDCAVWVYQASGVRQCHGVVKPGGEYVTTPASTCALTG